MLWQIEENCFLENLFRLPEHPLFRHLFDRE